MSSPRPMRALSGVFSRRDALKVGAAATAAVLLAACGDDDDESGTAGAAKLDLERAVTSFTIVAKNLEWDRERIVVATGEEITATIDNRDRGIPHNLHVKSPDDPMTELEEGPATQTLRFTIDKAGSYEFVCDAHPKMTGTIEAV